MMIYFYYKFVNKFEFFRKVKLKILNEYYY